MGNKKFTEWQIIIVVFLICLVLVISVDIRQGMDVYSSVKNNSAVFVFVALICFFASSILPKISFPTKKNIADQIRLRFLFLENFGYSYSRYAYNKKQKALEVYFSNPNLVDICVVYFYKLRENNAYMLIGDDFVNFRNLEDSYCESVSDEKRAEMTIEEYMEYVIEGVANNRDEIFRIKGLLDLRNKLF